MEGLTNPFVHYCDHVVAKVSAFVISKYGIMLRIRFYSMLVSTKFYYFKIVPPASPYIIIPPGGIIIYELAGGNIFKTRNVVDPIYAMRRVRVVG
jgi:hypothetical protein